MVIAVINEIPDNPISIDLAKKLISSGNADQVFITKSLVDEGFIKAHQVLSLQAKPIKNTLWVYINGAVPKLEHPPSSNVMSVSYDEANEAIKSIGFK